MSRQRTKWNGVIHAPQDEHDRAWLRSLWQNAWGGEVMLTRGRQHRLADLQALIAWEGSHRVGAATFRFDLEGCEMLSLNALGGGKGVGGALLEAVEELARKQGAERVWLITTNDNLDALRFYQRRSYRITAVYPGAVEQARKVKPTIPLVGYHGIAILDEVELERRL